MSSTLQQSAADLDLSAMGAKGSVLATDATVLTGEWRALLALTDCTFTTLTTNVTKNGVVTLAVAADWGTIAAGSVIYARITAVTRLTGTFQLFV